MELSECTQVLSIKRLRKKPYRRKNVADVQKPARRRPEESLTYSSKAFELHIAFLILKEKESIMAANQRAMQMSSTRPRDQAGDPLDLAQELIVGVLAREKLDGKSRKMLATAAHLLGRAQSPVERICGVLREPLGRAFIVLSILAIFASLVTLVAMLLR